MGQQQSRDQLLYQEVNSGNIDNVKSLYTQGAKLEYVDREGKTPLIAACLNPALYNAVKTLIELGANVNAYRPGSNGGTALHHAAKRGLENHVNLLISHGVNALLLNDDCQTALDIARAKGFSNIVRAIERHICLFSGWLREPLGPGFLDVLAPQLFGFLDTVAPNLLSRKVWAVVLPCGSRNLRKPFKLELAIYTSMQDAQPRLKMDLWKANMEEPSFNQPDPVVLITETSTAPRHGRRRRCRSRRVNRTQTRIKLAPINESTKQQLQQFCNACKGIPQVVHSNFPFNNASAIIPSTPAMVEPTNPPINTEELELAMAINASLQSARQHGHPPNDFRPSNGASSSISVFHSTTTAHETDPSFKKRNRTVHLSVEEAGTSGTRTEVPAPSAPLVENEQVHYTTIESGDMHPPILIAPESHSAEDESKKGQSSSCIICFDAPVEAACVPCGHMAGCVSCLNEIKTKNFGCPVCRAEIDQIIKVYSV